MAGKAKPSIGFIELLSVCLQADHTPFNSAEPAAFVPLHGASTIRWEANWYFVSVASLDDADPDELAVVTGQICPMAGVIGPIKSAEDTRLM